VKILLSQLCVSFRIAIPDEFCELERIEQNFANRSEGEFGGYGGVLVFTPQSSSPNVTLSGVSVSGKDDRNTFRPYRCDE
jgi:hypothetical protein